jgi:hypothetical protein
MQTERLAFIDLEYGQIYGSYRRDLIPVEIGMVFCEDMNEPHFESRKFYFDCDLVMRKNIVDWTGKTVGLSERVANSAKNEHQKPYDPGFELDNEAARGVRKNVAYKSFGMLNRYVKEMFDERKPTRLIFYSASQDLYILKKARIDVRDFEILDLQEDVTKALEVKDKVSLDRVSRLIGFKTNWRYIRSEHFTFGVPNNCRNFVKPHKAVGDAARIFLLHREFYEKNEEFLRKAKKLKQ